MRVLVACEESGVVRDAFLRRGHDAWSNDIQPARNGGPHLHMDCVDAMLGHGPWDIVIFHPPCTALSVSGNRHYGQGMPRHLERLQALVWTERVWDAAKICARVGACMENPRSVLWSCIPEKPQWIQPNMFGHHEQKATGLALHNLPKLKPTKDVLLEMQLLPRRVTERVHYMSPGPNRQRDRSETYLGIAEAMAEQWGAILTAEAA